MTEDRDLPTKGLLDYQARGPQAAFFYPAPFFSGLEQLLQIQKATLEMYARQTIAGIHMIQQLCPMIPAECVDTAERGIIDLLRIQTSTLDLIGSRIGAYPAFADGANVPQVLQDSANQCLAVHRKLLEIFTQQIQCFSAAFRWPTEISRQ